MTFSQWWISVSPLQYLGTFQWSALWRTFETNRQLTTCLCNFVSLRKHCWESSRPPNSNREKFVIQFSCTFRPMKRLWDAAFACPEILNTGLSCFIKESGNLSISLGKCDIHPFTFPVSGHDAWQRWQLQLCVVFFSTLTVTWQGPLTVRSLICCLYSVSHTAEVLHNCDFIDPQQILPVRQRMSQGCTETRGYFRPVQYTDSWDTKRAQTCCVIIYIK